MVSWFVFIFHTNKKFFQKGLVILSERQSTVMDYCASKIYGMSVHAVESRNLSKNVSILS